MKSACTELPDSGGLRELQSPCEGFIKVTKKLYISCIGAQQTSSRRYKGQIDQHCRWSGAEAEVSGIDFDMCYKSDDRDWRARMAAVVVLEEEGAANVSQCDCIKSAG